MKFFILEIPLKPIEISKIVYKHRDCLGCGTRPLGRVGSVAIKLTSRQQYSKIIWGGGLFALENVFTELEKAKILGWRKGFLEVSASKKMDSLTTNFSELIVIGKTKNFAQANDLKVEIDCKICGFRKYAPPVHGFDIPEECWDGSDIFYVDELPGIPIVSEDTKAFFESNIDFNVTMYPTKKWVPPYP